MVNLIEGEGEFIWKDISGAIYRNLKSQSKFDQKNRNLNTISATNHLFMLKTFVLG